MRRLCWLPLVIALVLMIVPYGLVGILMGRYQTVRVVVPRATIARCATIEPGMLVSVMWPTNGLFKGVVVGPDEALGRVAAIELAPEGPIHGEALVEPARAAEFGCPAP